MQTDITEHLAGILVVAGKLRATKIMVPSVDGINAGELVEGTDMKELVNKFIDKIIAVASGEEARNEYNGYREISIFKNGVTL